MKELFYEKNELDENGECFEHPGKRLDEVSEENYFFKLSKYEEDIKRILSDENDPQYIKIVPKSRKNEMLSFFTRFVNASILFLAKPEASCRQSSRLLLGNLSLSIFQAFLASSENL